MTRDMAEQQALYALSWLVGNEELLPVFLGATGASEDDLRARAAQPEFLASVLDFLLMDDAWVIACAQNFGWRPEQMLEIRSALPGGDLPNWT